MKKQFLLSVSSFCSEQRGTFFPGLKSGFHRSNLLVVIMGLALMLLISAFASATPAPVKSSQEMQIVQNDRDTDPVQEDLTLSGIVRDENNAPFPGVNIYVKKDNTIGTTSDEHGKFQLAGNIQTGDVIIFSFLGYEPVEYVVTEAMPQLLEIALTDFHIMMGDAQVDEPYQRESQLSQLWQKVKNIF